MDGAYKINAERAGGQNTLIGRCSGPLEWSGKPRPISLPSLGVHLQILQSPVLRESLMMNDEADSGILIAAIEDGGSAHGILQAGDVLLKARDEE